MKIARSQCAPSQLAGHRDHAEWARILHYILKNPVKAGIVGDWRDYPFSFYSEEAMKYVTI
jgi:hypothetical protein